MPRVYLSPSNHGVGQNKCLKSGCYEDKHTRPMAEACAKYLKAAGIEVKIAAASTGVLNGARTKEADNWGADLYVPIHTNAAGASARYLLFMFYADNSTYRKIFNAVAPKLEAIYPEHTTAHYSVRTDLYEIKSPKAKTLYCEMGFHTNKTDVEKFIHNADAIGKALAAGICEYFRKTPAEPEKEPEKKPAKEPVKTTGGKVEVELSILKRNSINEQVKTVQRILYCMYGCPAELKIDGEFGPIVEKYVKKFQKDNGLTQDGVVGVDTWTKLLK